MYENHISKDTTHTKSKEDHLFGQKMSKIIEENKIKLPLTRQDIVKICKLMGKECTWLTATEALLQCRGKQLENSLSFNMQKFVTYLGDRM